LARVDEIWIIETIFYGLPAAAYLRFERYDGNGDIVQSYDFNEGKLIRESEDRWPKMVQSTY
jgi:hypothetical protein